MCHNLKQCKYNPCVFSNKLERLRTHFRYSNPPKPMKTTNCSVRYSKYISIKNDNSFKTIFTHLHNPIYDTTMSWQHRINLSPYVIIHT